MGEEEGEEEGGRAGEDAGRSPTSVGRVGGQRRGGGFAPPGAGSSVGARAPRQQEEILEAFKKNYSIINV